MRTMEDVLFHFGEIPFCECGCEKNVFVDPRYFQVYIQRGYPIFLKGHYSRGMKRSEESKKKMSIAKTEYWRKEKSGEI